MKININTYRSAQLSPLRSFIERQPVQTTSRLLRAAQHFCTGSGMPIIVVVHLLCEIDGEKEEYVAKLKRLNDFYSITGYVSNVQLEAFKDLYL